MVLFLSIALALIVVGYLIFKLGPDLIHWSKFSISPLPQKKNYQYELGEELTPMPMTEEISKSLNLPTEHEKTHDRDSVPELPQFYGKDIIVALVRDPHWIYTYWEITPAKYEAINHLYGYNTWEDSQPVLRIYQTSDSGNHVNTYYDIFINNYASNWHINVTQSNQTLYVERGLILKSGQYIPLIRSNWVTTPADQISELIDEEWLLINENNRRLYQRIGELPVGASSPQYAYGIEVAEIAFGLGSTQLNQSNSSNQNN